MQLVRPLVLLLLVTPAFAGCVQPDGGGNEATTPRDDAPADASPTPAAPGQPPRDEEGPRGDALPPLPRCTHPWPCRDGSEWPPDLKGPFELDHVERVEVTVADGVTLRGWVLRPALPDGVRAPVVLWSSAYFGQLYSTPEAPAVSTRPDVLPVEHLVENGYAVALFNVRGTGHSDGCFGLWSVDEQRDQVALVEWLAAQPWSNGRVGMSGISYSAATAWSAAVQSPRALKTILTGGIVADAYTLFHSPQGASSTTAGGWQDAWLSAFSAAPPLVDDPSRTPGAVERAPGRACPDLAPFVSESVQGHVGPARNADFWNDRALVRGFPNVTAAVFLYHGFQDRGFHALEEDAVWPLLDAPKRMMEGQWAHEPPNRNAAQPDWSVHDWPERFTAWLDFWLKGDRERPPRLGVVDYQDDSGAWREADAWPPREAVPQALFVSADGLTAAPSGGSSWFRSLPHPDGPFGPLCDALEAEAAGVPAEQPFGVVAFGEPLREDVVLAGNPLALLRLTSDAPGGLVSVDVFELEPDARCEANTDGSGYVRTAPALVHGVADLQYHAGGLDATPFPTGTPALVRVDLPNVASVIEAGNRLAVVVHSGEGTRALNSGPHHPQLIVHGDASAASSQIVLPVLAGSLGGEAPGVTYPPRPRLPHGP